MRGFQLLGMGATDIRGTGEDMIGKKVTSEKRIKGLREEEK